MKPAELLSSVRARGVELRDEGGVLRVAPASALTDEERALLQQHAEAVIALLRAPKPRDELVVELTVDAILRAEAEAEESARAAAMAPPPPVVTFRTQRGWMELRALSPDEVRSLEAAGKISPEEVLEWSRTRRRWLVL